MFIKCEIIKDFARVQLTRDVEIPGGVLTEGTIMELILVGNPPCTRLLMEIETQARLYQQYWPVGIWYKLLNETTKENES